jgi:hypothetical protein
MLQDDIYWRQRAKKHWYKDGDKNTKFFQASANARKKAKCIPSLEDDNNVKVTNIDALCSVAKNYFADIFQSKPSHMALVIDNISQTVTNDLVKLPCKGKLYDLQLAIFTATVINSYAPLLPIYRRMN